MVALPYRCAVFGRRIQHAAARHDQRSVGRRQHRQRLFDLATRCFGLIDGQGFVRIDIEFDFRELHVDRQIDQHRTRTARAHQMKCLLEHARHERRFTHGHRPLGHRLGDRFDIDGLEVFLIEP
jgi:hypothetical protein